MRSPWTVALLVLVGCAVPDVEFYDASDDAAGHADAAARDGAPDAPGPAPDAGGAVDAGSADATHAADAAADAPQAEDAPYDGYCYGNPPPPAGGKCCGAGNSGPPCYGDCNAQGCAACGTCQSPKVCCTLGAQGSCLATCGP